MRTIFTILLLIVAVPSQAMDSNGKYAVWGVGRKACFTYSKDKKAGSGDMYAQYAMGYLTAYNAITDKTYNISGRMNLTEVGAWLDDYCGRKPMNSFDQALVEFIHEHEKSRDQQAPTGYSR